jgi:RimJ/RimL family protein N-acetyltransferase
MHLNAPLHSNDKRVTVVLFPYTESKRITLRPATVDDGKLIYEVLFRLGRSTLPTVDAFLNGFGKGVGAYFLIYSRDTGEMVGFTEVVDLSPAGHVRVAVHVAAGQDSAVTTDATALTVNFAFANWRIRKVYFRASESDPAALGLPARDGLIRTEGVFPDHLFFQGRLWDMHVYSIAREQWDTHGTDLLEEMV